MECVVEATQPAVDEDKKTEVGLDTASFDGFSIIWTPGVNVTTHCNVPVIFNFLSMDFTHSKGIKGIQVRLCAKTELVSSGSPQRPVEAAELCFCKVKLFKDHGAERKMSNEIAHIKKTIDKLKQQITQAESGMKNLVKRKPTGSIATNASATNTPGKFRTQKRTWPMSLASSAGRGREPAEDDLYYKLKTMHDIWNSTRPVSALDVRGEDPDLHPVQLMGEPSDLIRGYPSYPSFEGDFNNSSRDSRYILRRSSSNASISYSKSLDPMSILISKYEVPPPLPPPRHIEELEVGSDSGWQWGDTIGGGFGKRGLQTINASLSLNGGRDRHTHDFGISADCTSRHSFASMIKLSPDVDTRWEGFPNKDEGSSTSFWTGGNQNHCPPSMRSRSSSMNSSLYGTPKFDPYEQNPVFPSSPRPGERQPHEGLDKRPTLPPPPVELGTKHQPSFDCDICGETVKVNNPREWQ